MKSEIRRIIGDMRAKEKQLWSGNPPRMGCCAVALMLDGYASRLEVAIGDMPKPKGVAE